MISSFAMMTQSVIVKIAFQIYFSSLFANLAFSFITIGSKPHDQFVKPENISLVTRFKITRMRTVSEEEGTFSFDAVLRVCSVLVVLLSNLIINNSN